jgi:hypothetical protein
MLSMCTKLTKKYFFFMLQSLQVPGDRGSGLAVSGKTMVSDSGKGFKKFIRHIGKLAMLNSVSKMAAVLS